MPRHRLPGAPGQVGKMLTNPKMQNMHFFFFFIVLLLNVGFIYGVPLEEYELFNLLSVICRGTDELLGVMDRVHIVNSTLGKALGGAAGTSPVTLIT